jgi:hypothetical protein
VIDRAVSRFCSTLGTVVILITALPSKVGVEDPAVAERHAAPARTMLAEQRSVDWAPLLDELASAVTAECGVYLDLSKEGPVTVVPPEMSAEEQAASGRRMLGEQRQVDWAPLMAELACAVTAECDSHLGLSKEGPVTVVSPEMPASGHACPPADGPEAGCRVRYGGKVVAVKGRTYAVIDFIWKKEFVQFDDLIWAASDGVQDSTVHTWITRANASLVPLNLPWRLEADGVARVVRKCLADTFTHFHI